MNLDTLYNAPIDTINLADIEEFCSYKIKESETLDYKADLNDGNLDKVVETIAAMANTDGGIIIVGVPEKKNSQGGNTGVPDSVDGFQPDVKNNILQRISSVCWAKLQPIYVPELKDIPIDGTEKIVLLIRINRDSAIELPIYHREKGIKIRSGEDVKFATPAQIKQLLDENNGVAPAEIDFNDCRNLLANSPQDMNWLSFALAVPKKRYTKSELLSTLAIYSIRDIVNLHSISGQRTWLERYYPNHRKSFEPPNQRSAEFFRSAYSIDLIPKRNHQVSAKIDQTYYKLHFSTEGMFTALIGFASNEEKPFGPESITSALHSIIDLFSNTQITDLFPNLHWKGQCKSWLRLSIYNGILNRNIVPFSVPNGIIIPNSISEGSFDYYLEEMSASEKAKELSAYLLAQLGCWDYEVGLNNLDLINNLY